jgi:curved DNA-binding protein CbpA
LSNRSEGPGPSSVSYTFEIDPWGILGVPASATLEQIRDAYHAKARKHHPDTGGDDWAFRIVARAYEILSTARVAGRAAQEVRRPPVESEPEPTPKGKDSDWRQPGRRDSGYEPGRIVDVEVLLLRYEPKNPTSFLLRASEERNLSCCLNVSWSAPPGQDDSAAEPVRQLLNQTLETVAKQTKAAATWSRSEAGEFEGWLSYPVVNQTWESLRVLHKALNTAGLGMNQWTREMLIPGAAR